jgi:signal peptidase
MYTLQKDDVITFYTIIDNIRVLNTHRIVEVKDDGGSRTYITRGDNNPVDDEIPVYPSDIVGKWTGAKVKGGGKILDFLRSKTGFFICVVIPMAIFFLFELYKFIVALIESKQKMSKDEEDEIKRKAIEEYLAQQAGNAQENTPAEAATGDSAETGTSEAAAENTSEESQE